MPDRKKPRDTRADAEGFLAQSMVIGATDAILLQESAGQREIVESTVIPTEMSCNIDELEALGFVLGDVHVDDPLFRDVTLPDGWYREGSDHAMWSYICDSRGFRRCSIFYKAAFYDRRAHFGLVQEPVTKAQSDTYEAFADIYENAEWGVDSYKEGDNLVRRARRCALEDGRKVYDHQAGDWKYTGEVHERVIAPDGSTVARRPGRRGGDGAEGPLA